jgi:hypothetical protein
MQQVGYSLIDASGVEIEFWGDTIGQSQGVPDRIRLPNGDLVHGARPGDVMGEYRLVPRFATLGSANGTAVEGQALVVTRTVTAQMVKSEAQRRIIAMTGAADMTMCLIKQSNANMRANRLNDVRMAREWTPDEAAEAQALRTLALTIKAIRDRSNAIEAMIPIPADYADDRHWAVVVEIAAAEADRLSKLRDQLAVGLQMTDAQLDIIGGVLPTPERYPDLARVLNIAPNATIGQWRDAIQALKLG